MVNHPQKKYRRYWRWSLLIGSLLAILFILMLSPSHQGDWTPLQAQLPQVSRQGSDYHLSNLRDFRYQPDGSVREKNYLQKNYSLSDLKQVWFGISHFGGYGLAHTFLSFEFSVDNFLAASVEARLRPGQGYHPIRGLLRQYNKIVVLGTEADIIGLRARIRQERVLLYPLQLSPEQRNYLFNAVMEDAQSIAQSPAFYNTLLDNCTTNLLKHDPDYRFYTSLLDYRLLLPGYSDAVAHEKGWLDNAMPLDDLRHAALIHLDGTDHEAENFSAAIRRGWRVGQPD